MNVLICNMTQIIDVNEKSLFGYHNFTLVFTRRYLIL